MPTSVGAILSHSRQAKGTVTLVDQMTITDSNGSRRIVLVLSEAVLVIVIESDGESDTEQRDYAKRNDYD